MYHRGSNGKTRNVSKKQKLDRKRSDNSLIAIDRVTMKMSATAFKPVYEKIVTSTESADFDFALDIILNHNEIRPQDPESLQKYASFLVKNMETADNPNRVLLVLRREFSEISKPEAIMIGAVKNKASNISDAAITEAHFLDAYDDVVDVSDVFRKLCTAGIAGNVLAEIVDKLENHKKDALYLQMVNELDDTTKAQELIEYVDMACSNIAVVEARTFLLGCLQKSFKQVNNSECSISIIDKIKQHESYFRSERDVTAATFREGFMTTTSDALKAGILTAVSALRIKPQFKKGLGEDDLDYYKKWMK